MLVTPSTSEYATHVLENLNFASPFRDWDDGDYTIQEFKERSNSVKKEMFGTQAINFLATIIMLLPLWLTGNHWAKFFIMNRI